MRTGATFERLADELDPPGPVPGTVRHRVLSGIMVAQSRKPARRWLLATASVTAAATAAVVTGSFVVQIGSTVSDQAPPSGAAIELLSRAAAFVRQETVPAPKHTQFVFIEIKSWSPASGRDGRATLIRTWRSVDGDADGLVRRDEPGPDGQTEFPLPGCRDGRAAQWTGDGRLDTTRTRPCEPEPGYRADLPTSPDGMLAYLRSRPGGTRDDRGVFAAAIDLLQGTYLPAAARAATFLAVAKVPGVTVRPDVTDAAGRAGVAIGQGTGTLRQELIFAPGTGQFLGVQLSMTGASSTAAVRPTALLRMTIVDKAGEVPA